jgi:YqaJ-like viral recombinase domain
VLCGLTIPGKSITVRVQTSTSKVWLFLKQIAVKKQKLLAIFACKKIHKIGATKKSVALADKDYGPDAAGPDIPEEDMTNRKDLLMAQLAAQVDSEEKRINLQLNTVGQYSCALFRRVKANLLTSSNFGKIYKRGRRGKAKHPHKLIATLRSGKDISRVSAVEYGLLNEEGAKERFAAKTGLEVRAVGIFINEKWPHMGASPDGAAGENAIIEVKCLYAARFRQIFDFVAERQGVDEHGDPIMENGKKKKKTDFSSLCLEIFNGALRLKKDHNYFYQIQGQLAISGKEKCFFVAATDVDLFIEEIFPEPELWKQMEKKLSAFYFDCLLPEIL